MGVTLDGQAVFDEQELTLAVRSPSRASLQRSVAGLDGVLSIDLGARPRQVRQTGVLRAAGRAALNARLEAIAAFLDGRTHTLTTADGRTYRNLRLDSFQPLQERTGGPGIVVEYEIVYTQLGE
ncbi:MAG: hypothetical protein FJ280_29675 [Planctomycetes bacterium]|nr:hypothetical protein [Planctomycetota bacterium]